jgi:hypothetical protein
MVKVDGWELIWHHLRGYVLTAESVTGHPRLTDDRPITMTSTVESIDFLRGVAVTRNTTYLLGTPKSAVVDPAYARI